MKMKRIKNYKCDRCNKELSVDESYGIFIKMREEKYPLKRWDFCEKCYSAMVKGVEKGRGVSK